VSWKKRELINEAYGELSVAKYNFDLTPDEMQTGLRRLNTMMATWDAQGIKTGYAMGSNANELDLDEESGITDAAHEAVFMNLAIRLAGGLGKALPLNTLVIAKQAYDVLLIAAAQPSKQQYPQGLPVGAGNKRSRYGSPFFAPPDTSVVRNADNGDLAIQGA
jgi:P22 tail accessory factor